MTAPKPLDLSLLRRRARLLWIACALGGLACERASSEGQGADAAQDADPAHDAADVAHDAELPDAPSDADMGPDADAAPDDADAGPDEPACGGSSTEAWAVCGGLYEPPKNAGATQDEGLVEASGVTASLRDPGVLWMHNDSGDEARLFAVGLQGEALGRVRLRGVEAEDFEDINAAPCPDGSGPCLWVADIGDNLLERDRVLVHVFPEPEVPAEGLAEEREVSVTWTFPARYPGGAVDSEALMVAPDGKRFYLFEKIDGPQARVFRHAGPFISGRAVELEEVATFRSPGVAIPRGRMITGADMHPSGRRFLVRVYTGSFEYRLCDGQEVEDLAEVEPVVAAPGPLSEEQGEAVGYNAQGDGFWTISEDRQGEPGQVLHRYPCAEAAP